MLLITQPCITIVTEEALRSHPDECCGFMLGMEDKNERCIQRIITCKNRARNPRNSFLISAADYLLAEETAKNTGLHLLGIYHSHPNSKATPSATDKEAAFPFFSYLIVSVMNGEIAGISSWTLTDDFSFSEEKISIQSNNNSETNFIYGNYNHSYTTA